MYVNGVEVSRYNMDPAASIAFGTMATVGVTTLAAATTPFNISIPDAYWFNGNNILAVEVCTHSIDVLGETLVNRRLLVWFEPQV